MIKITLPDGSIKEFESGSTPMDVAMSISEGLARNVISAKFNNNIVEVSTPLTTDGNLTLFTFNDAEGKKAFWHSTSHVMAQALEQLYPGVKLTIGPAIERGFYYDVDFGDQKISENDFKKIEDRMLDITRGKHEFKMRSASKAEALEFYRKQNNPFKVELIENLEDGTITFCDHDTFTDLCRGGHIPNTGFIKAVKLTSAAGAYWRGDEKNPQLTRVYGISFPKQKDLKEYLELLEEAKKRDHRKLGKELGLFAFSQKVGQGLPLWLPKGAALRERLENFLKAAQKKAGYEMVVTPHIGHKELYITSGHYAKYGEDSFQPIKTPNEGEEFLLKPMNCPHHTQIYAAEPRSYRDLPLRYAETTMVYRDEQAGELMGLSRVRAITQDDGHIFCTPEQIKTEVNNIVSIIKQFYTSLDMFNEGSYWVSLSVRDSQNLDKYIGDDDLWDTAESILEDIAKENNLNYKRIEGEAAFYGPKLDFQFKDALGREWQLGTAQLDFVQPARFELSYTDHEGQKQTPVMIHRAIAGSLERFMSLAIEHFAGHFPMWLAPTQIAIIPINPDAHGEYAQAVHQQFKDIGARVELWNDDHDNFGKKVRKAKNDKLPYWIIIGDEEMNSNTITVESKDAQQKGVTIEAFIGSIKKDLK